MLDYLGGPGVITMVFSKLKREVEGGEPGTGQHEKSSA